MTLELRIATPKDTIALIVPRKGGLAILVEEFKYSSKLGNVASLDRHPTSNQHAPQYMLTPNNEPVKQTARRLADGLTKGRKAIFYVFNIGEGLVMPAYQHPTQALASCIMSQKAFSSLISSIMCLVSPVACAIWAAHVWLSARKLSYEPPWSGLGVGELAVTRLSSLPVDAAPEGWGTEHSLIIRLTRCDGSPHCPAYWHKRWDATCTTPA
ncbi:hypothetical protein QBC37DRAFT_370385 [Rhypophila decipiens]|uniref:Uncharacterized protein n=1 Tax=Rhypophila decipiens TaxID=261697 RepID=A0AAN6YE60_9PEZI|nr:hypothetical protein QBC37DRAFT_370385 [Rhypophila decipiens]